MFEKPQARPDFPALEQAALSKAPLALMLFALACRSDSDLNKFSGTTEEVEDDAGTDDDDNEDSGTNNDEGEDSGTDEDVDIDCEGASDGSTYFALCGPSL